MGVCGSVDNKNVVHVEGKTQPGDLSCMCYHEANKPRIDAPKLGGKDPFNEVQWSILIVHLHQAINLPQADRLSENDAFVKCELLAGEGSAWKGKESAGIADVNRCAFRIKENTNSPKWDAMRTICFDSEIPRKDLRLHCEIMDDDKMPGREDTLGKVVLRLPESDKPHWKLCQEKLDNGGELKLSLKTVQSPFYDVPTLDFLQQEGWKEEIIVASKEKASLLYNMKDGNTRMLFLVPGRGDTFQHFHIVKPFQDRGFDIFCLDYHGIGRAKRFGQGKEADLYVSHAEDHSEYVEEFDIALQFIRNQKGTSYDVAMYHVHSTGGPIFLHYCMERNDNFGMTHLIMNSPYIASTVDAADSRLAAFVLEKHSERKTDRGGGKKTLPGNAPDEQRIPAWSFKLWAQYRHHPNLRSIHYSAAITYGFFAAVEKTQEKFNKAGRVTSRPTLLLCSKNDDVLDQKDMFQAADKISPDIKKVVFDYQCHDVYLSYDAGLTEQAIENVVSWVDDQMGESGKYEA